MFKKIALTAAAFGMSATFAVADVASNKALVATALNEVFAKGNVEALDTYFTETYIQHNPMMPSGTAPLKMMLSQPKDPNAPKPQPNEIHRVIGEGDLVATHTTYYNFGPAPLVAFDVFRIEDGKIAEHWDNLAPLADQPNPSGRTQVDGAVEITDLDKTEANKAVVVELIEKAFINGEKIDITQYISPVTYLQHSTNVADGLEGLGQMLAYVEENNIDFYYTEIGLVVAEGNFVLVGSEGVFGEQATAFYDLFRLKDGLIVEHWDVIAAMPGDDVPEGYPGKF